MKSKWLPAVLLLFIIAEIGGILFISRRIGGWPTFMLILLAAIGGIWLIKTEGRKVWVEAMRQLQAGHMPGWALLDGLCVLGGGMMLIVPGFLTDIAGITMLIPPTRRWYRLWLYKMLERAVRSGRFTFRRFPPHL